MNGYKGVFKAVGFLPTEKIRVTFISKKSSFIFDDTNMF